MEYLVLKRGEIWDYEPHETDPELAQLFFDGAELRSIANERGVPYAQALVSIWLAAGEQNGRINSTQISTFPELHFPFDQMVQDGHLRPLDS